MGAKGETDQSTRLRHIKVAREYCQNGFIKWKAIRKFYPDMSEASCKSNTYNIFSQDVIQEEIEKHMRRATGQANFGADRVMRLLAAYANAGETLAKFKKDDGKGGLKWDFTDATEDDLMLINSIENTEMKDGSMKTKVSHADPLVALDKLARIHGMFDDKLNIQTEMSLIDRINSSRARISQPGTIDTQADDVSDTKDEDDD